MRDTDLAVVTPEASLTIFDTADGFLGLDTAEMQEFAGGGNLAPGSKTDLLIGSTETFSVGQTDGATSNVSSSNTGEQFEELLIANLINNAASLIELPEPQVATLAVPSGGTAASFSEEASANNSILDTLSNDITDQFLSLPSFLGQI